MKILQLLHSKNFAGSEQLVLTLCLALKRAGHEVVVMTKDGGILTSRFRDAGVQVAGVPMNSLFLRRKLARWVRENGIDVAHAHLTEATRVACMLHRDTGMPVVAHLHVMRHAGAYKEMAACGLLVAISEHAFEFFNKEAGLPPGRIRTVINATDAINTPEATMPVATLAAAWREELGLPGNARLLAFPGRISPEKGHEIVIRAMPDVLGAHPNAHVLIAGNLDQKKAYVSHLRRLCVVLGLGKNIHFLGWRSDVLQLTRASEAQLVPSKREPFGLVVIEAMAMGTPVIGTAAGAIPEILEGGRLGTLVPYGDTRALAVEINSLLSNTQTYTEKAALARQRVLTCYTPERMAKETLAVYNEALEMVGRRGI